MKLFRRYKTLVQIKEEANALWIIHWCERMTQQYGDTVRDITGKDWKWHHAIFNEQHGWPPTDDKLNTAPSLADNLRAVDWEAGTWPLWVDKEHMLAVKALNETTSTSN